MLIWQSLFKMFGFTSIYIYHFNKKGNDFVTAFLISLGKGLFDKDSISINGLVTQERTSFVSELTPT